MKVQQKMKQKNAELRFSAYRVVLSEMMYKLAVIWYKFVFGKSVFNEELIRMMENGKQIIELNIDIF